MTTFEAYALTTLVPNLGCAFRLIAVFSSIGAVMVALLNFIIFDGEHSWKPTWLLFWVCLISGLSSAFFPSQAQVAEMIGFKMATSQSAQSFYGDAGDFMHAWLRRETKELLNDNEEKKHDRSTNHPEDDRNRWPRRHGEAG